MHDHGLDPCPLWWTHRLNHWAPGRPRFFITRIRCRSALELSLS